MGGAQPQRPAVPGTTCWPHTGPGAPAQSGCPPCLLTQWAHPTYLLTLAAPPPPSRNTFLRLKTVKLSPTKKSKHFTKPAMKPVCFSTTGSGSHPFAATGFSEGRSIAGAAPTLKMTSQKRDRRLLPGLTQGLLPASHLLQRPVRSHPALSATLAPQRGNGGCSWPVPGPQAWEQAETPTGAWGRGTGELPQTSSQEVPSGSSPGTLPTPGTRPACLL